MGKIFFLAFIHFFFLVNINAQETGTFIDERDGREYKWVKIGEQVWMAENLAYKAKQGCWAYGNDETNVNKNGRLYNWTTAQNVCPSGWHIPNNSAWELLLQRQKNLQNPAVFAGLLAGGRTVSGEYSAMDFFGTWWSNTEVNSSNANCFITSALYSEYTITKDRNKKEGYSVRCIKD